jgi:hypothetical protein
LGDGKVDENSHVAIQYHPFKLRLNNTSSTRFSEIDDQMLLLFVFKTFYLSLE